MQRIWAKASAGRRIRRPAGCSSSPCSRSQAAHSRRTAGSKGAGRRSGPRASSWAAWSARSRPGTEASRSSSAAVGIVSGELVAAGGCRDHRVDQLGIALDRSAGGGQDQLRVGRGAVAVDLEDPDRDALPAQRHPLGIPEAGCGVDLAGGQRGDRVEPDRHPVHPVGVSAVGARPRSRRPLRRRAGRSPRPCVPRGRGDGAPCPRRRRAPVPTPAVAARSASRRPGRARARARSRGRGCRGSRSRCGPPRAALARRSIRPAGGSSGRSRRPDKSLVAAPRRCPSGPR